MLNVIKFLAIPLVLSGCSTIMPNTIGPNYKHMSHLTQHRPFTSNPTNYGADMIGVVAKWKITPNLNLSLGESINLEKKYPGFQEYGDIVGPREQFSAEVSYDFKIKGN
jgi:uncharacterized protein YceK